MGEELIAAKATENNLLARLARAEDRIAQLEKNQRQPLNPPDYTLTSISVLRTLTSSSALADVINVLGTVINDLIAQGRFK